MCAAVLDAVAPEQRTALIQEQFPGPERYTLIDTTGEVVSDSISLYALVEVKDTGMGISEEDQPKVFERFYRTEKSRSKETGGTGLGLAIVKHVALTHGGDVSVKSALGKGSTFTMRIPL